MNDTNRTRTIHRADYSCSVLGVLTGQASFASHQQLSERVIHFANVKKPPDVGLYQEVLYCYLLRRY